MTKIERYRANDLHFDRHNPRLVEYSNLKSEEDIIKVLWDNMAVNEIVMSILANGFFENEAMYAIKENGKVVIVEGNRRLAAVKAILNPELIKGMAKYTYRITEQLKQQLSTSLPVIVLDKREDAWRYIGFKHVNGAVKWDSYAKAEYIAQVHNEYGVALDDIAEQIGDSNKITLKLYQGLMVLRQADKETNFKIADVYNNRVYFSHIYTAIMYEGFQDYLGIDITQHTDSPVPTDKLSNLEEVMFWILGSKSKRIKPIIKSQNPDIRNLNQVLTKPDATQLLKSSNDLSVAYDMSLDGGDIFYQTLVEAQIRIQKALSKISFYRGDDDMLQTAINIADSADALYKGMKSIRAKINGKEDKRTID